MRSTWSKNPQVSVVESNRTSFDLPKCIFANLKWILKKVKKVATISLLQMHQRTTADSPTRKPKQLTSPTIIIDTTSKRPATTDTNYPATTASISANPGRQSRYLRTVQKAVQNPPRLEPGWRPNKRELKAASMMATTDGTIIR